MRPKALVSDFDGTLIEPFFAQFLNLSFLRAVFGGIFSHLPAPLQKRLIKTTKWLKIAKEYQEGGAELFLVTARKESERSRQRLKFLLKSIGLEINSKNIFMRPPDCNAIEHKENTIAKIAEKYEILGILEDEERFHSVLRRFGPILNDRF